jgi:hypothetical protein
LRITSSDADKLTAAPLNWAAVLVFGANTGLVRGRTPLRARIVPDPSDAFRVADLTGDTPQDPAAGGERNTISMFRRRVVRAAMRATRSPIDRRLWRIRSATRWS